MDLLSCCFDYLKQKGLSPEYSHGIIVFKYQMRYIFIGIGMDKNDDFLDLYLPRIIHGIPSSDWAKCLELVNEANSSRKAVKFMAKDDEIYARIEVFVGSSLDLADFMPRCLDALIDGQELLYALVEQYSSQKQENSKRIVWYRSIFKRTNN